MNVVYFSILHTEMLSRHTKKRPPSSDIEYHKGGLIVNKKYQEIYEKQRFFNLLRHFLIYGISLSDVRG